MEKTLKNAKNLLKTKPWTKDHYKENFYVLFENTKKWYFETKKKQDKLLSNEVNSKIIKDPAFSAEVLETKLLKVMNEYKLMSQIPKPKAEGTSTFSDKPTEKEKNNNAMPKEDVDKLINNAKDIDELKDLLV